MAIRVMMRASYRYDDAAYRAQAAQQLRVPETEAQEAWLKSLEVNP